MESTVEIISKSILILRSWCQRWKISLHSYLRVEFIIFRPSALVVCPSLSCLKDILHTLCLSHGWNHLSFILCPSSKGWRRILTSLLRPRNFLINYLFSEPFNISSFVAQNPLIRLPILSSSQQLQRYGSFLLSTSKCSWSILVLQVDPSHHWACLVSYIFRLHHWFCF